MNDQWSGNTLFERAAGEVGGAEPPVEPPRDSLVVGGAFARRRHRSRSQKPGPTGPEKSPRAMSSPSSSTPERQLRERPGGGTEDRPGAVEHVERRLVARAQQQAGVGLVEADRATDVGAQLRVGDDVVDRPVLAARPGPEVLVGPVRMSSVGRIGGVGVALGPHGDHPVDGSGRRLARACRPRSRRASAPSPYGVVFRPLPGRGPSDRIGNRSAAPRAASAEPASPTAAAGGRCPPRPPRSRRRSASTCSSEDATLGRSSVTSSCGMACLGPHHDADTDAAGDHREQQRPRAGCWPPRQYTTAQAIDAERADGEAAARQLALRLTRRLVRHRLGSVVSAAGVVRRRRRSGARVPIHDHGAEHVPMPKNHATKPSGTGPVRPIGTPPGPGVAQVLDVAQRCRSAASSSSTSGPNTGIWPGPDRTAAPTCSGVAWTAAARRALAERAAGARRAVARRAVGTEQLAAGREIGVVDVDRRAASGRCRAKPT